MDDIGPITAALDESVADAKLPKLDAAGVELAYRYAAWLDFEGNGADSQYEVLNEVGPKFLKVLNELGLTPAGRASLKGGETGGSTGNVVIDELRERRESRARRAATVHPTPAAADA